jgi:hypothetical protein
MYQKPTETWIPVITSKGAFSSEYAVSLTCLDGQEVSLFADKTQVKTENNQAYLLVTLVNSDPGYHRQTVLLPTETFETSSRWVEVRQE